MKYTTRITSSRGLFKGFFAVLLTLSGILAGAAHSAPTVDQAPLTVQKPLPPNIVLMLDDSGSMAWDVMPDYGYLSDTSNSGLTSSDINGVYYNPNVTYTLPPSADNTTTFPNSSFTNAWIDGYKQSTGTVNLLTYDGSDDSSQNGSSSSSIDYNTTLKGTFYYTTTLTCTSGYTLSGSGSTAVCKKTGQTNKTPSGTCSGPTGGSFDTTTLQCKVTNLPFFNYSVLNSSGSGYTTYYVGITGECAALTTPTTTCKDDAATQLNVANWYTYYHTRILMAKSGLMIAFSDLDPTTRLGFGSIDGGNRTTTQLSSILGSDYYAFTTSVTSGGQKFSYTSGLAIVKTFGDGTTGTQKLNFWNWIISEQPAGGTPLRMALDFVGQYYQTLTPWQSPNPIDSTKTDALACRQAYTILTTDGFWNDSFSSKNYSDSDSTAGSKITSPKGQTYQYSPAAPYSDSTSTTLADVASYYWKTDLRTDINNEVLFSTADPAFWQHMTTFTVGLGFSPEYVDKNNNPTTVIPIDQVFNWANGGTAISGFSWPKPASDSINNIADLAHAAVDGHGGFYSAKSPQEFASGIANALNRAASRGGTGASLASNSAQLQAGDYIYQTYYYTSTWVGDLQAFQVSTTDGSIIANPSPPSAATAMPTYDKRNVWTYNPTSKTYTQFSVSNLTNLSSTQQALLGGNSSAQQTMIKYLLGDSSQEQKQNGVYRDRVNTTVSPAVHDSLGDIIDSQPVYVGTPGANLYNNITFTGSTKYAAFATGSTRSPTLWVAANDGMLHAFQITTDSTNLKEIYAYMPAAVLNLASPNGITNLSDPAYGSSGVPHQDYNDGLMTVADAYINSAWSTILVGTTGRGLARSVYALDITDPTKPKFLWERSAGDGLTNSGYIGQMTGQPVIAQTADNTWSVLMGNGYNSTAVTGGTAALLQFSLTDGTLTVYKAGTGTGTGLSAPAVWIGNATNGISTIAYAGDLLGNVYSFDLTSPGGDGTLLFKTGTSQPIMGGMLAGQDPDTGNRWLFFGTGQYLSQNDIANISSSTPSQYWYGIIVQSGPGQSTTSPAVTSSTTTAKLVQRTITTATSQTNGLNTRTITTASNGDMTNMSGWYIQLPTAGERMVTVNQFQGRVLVGTTRIPVATDLCNPSGSGWIMAIDPFTGGATDTNFFPDYASSMVGFSSVPNNPIFIGDHLLTSFDDASKVSLNTAPPGGNLKRMSWREFISH